MSFLIRGPLRHCATSGGSHRMLSMASRGVVRRAPATARSVWLRGFSGLALVTAAAWQFQMHESLTAYCDAAGSESPTPTTRAETATGINFPLYLSSLTSQDVPMVLLGVGVRTVSFLRVKVYAAGFYIEQDALGVVSGSSGDGVKPDSSLSKTGQVKEETHIAELIGRPIACAVRIVPTRNTDFGHLRDGFTRALIARQKSAANAGSLTAQEAEHISAAVQTFKGFFPSASVPKGKELLLIKTKAGRLAVEYEGKVLGELNDAWVAREMMLAYFSTDNVISAPLKADVAEGLRQLEVAGRH